MFKKIILELNTDSLENKQPVNLGQISDCDELRSNAELIPKATFTSKETYPVQTYVPQSKLREFWPKRYIRLPVTALMKEIGRSFHRHYGVEASLESILGRIWIKELFSSRRVSHQFDASIRDIPFEGAHTIDQALRETDRVVQDSFVNVRVTPIMGTTRVYDAALVRVVCHRQTWKDTFKNVGKKGIESIQPGCTRYLLF